MFRRVDYLWSTTLQSKPDLNRLPDLMTSGRLRMGKSLPLAPPISIH